MFIDASPKYTNTDLNYKKNNPIVVERFVQKKRSMTDYSYTKMLISLKAEKTNYSYTLKSKKVTPENLKKAMFRTSSKGIAAALRKK